MGEHLKKRRLENGLRQVDAAELLTASIDSYRGWEADRVEPEAASWTRIVGFLGYDPSPEPTTLGEHLKRRRRALGLTQEQAASIMGVSPDSYQGWEGDSYPPLAAMRVRLMRFLGYDPGPAPVMCTDGV